MSTDVSRPRPPRTRRLVAALACAALAGGLGGCGGTADDDAGSPLTMWSHGGTPAEREALRDLVRQWERTTGTAVELTVLEEGTYNDGVQAAAAAGSLPDVLDLDGPWTADLAYRGDLLPLDELLPAATRQDLLPSLVAQGTYRGRLYSVGAFDSGLGLFADASRLAEAGVRVPTGPDDAWSAEETTAALQALAVDDTDGRVLDLRLGYGVGEWLTYAFAPLLASAGTDLVDPTTGLAGGRLDSAAAVGALTELASWRAFTDPDPDGTAFVDREVALSWVGHWEQPAYADALGEDLVLLPLPDLGHGSRSALGSWAWTVPSTTDRPALATDLVDHLLSPDAVRVVTAANSAVPGRVSVLEATRAYQPGGALHLYADQLTRACDPGRPAGAPADTDADRCVAVARPTTPAYPVVTAAFAEAVGAVLDGTAAPQEALERAAGRIDGDAALNDGYGTG